MTRARTVVDRAGMTSACSRCNGAKRDLGLRVFLYPRRWSASPVHPGEPVRATRRSVRRWP